MKNVMNLKEDVWQAVYGSWSDKRPSVIPVVPEHSMESMAGFSLRPYQKDAVDNTFACIRENAQHGYCISAPCASGKSLMIAEIARRVVSGEELVGGSGRVLVVSHVQEIVQQDYEHLNLLLPNCVGIFSAGLKRRDVSEKVIVAGIQSVWRSTRVGRFDMLVVDECFVAGTLISTPRGDVPIEEIKAGDVVYNADGVGNVEAVSTRLTSELICIELENSTKIQCTENHPFYTECGWVKAKDILMGLGQFVYSREDYQNAVLDSRGFPKWDVQFDEWGFPIRGTEVFYNKEVSKKFPTRIGHVRRMPDTKKPVKVYNLQVSGHPSYYANGVLVHNCHLLPPHETSMYRTLLKRLREDNPDLVLVGLTATPFRTDGGNIYGEGKLFDRLSYDIDYKTLTDQGYIVRCRAKEIEIMTEDDFRKLRVKMGEYDQSSINNLYSVLKIDDILKDIVNRTEQCKQVLVFSPSVPACFVMQKQLSSFGGAEVITGETPKERRTQLIEDFKNFKFKYLINVNCLTTGFNVTTIDCVAFVRPTKSPVLYAQTVARGIRKSEGKEFVTLLDYGGNVRRHGTIDDLYIPDYEEIKKSREERKLSTNSRFSEPFGYSDEIERDTNSDVTKICPECKEIVRTHVKTCPDCGFDFVADEERKAKEEEERKAKQAEEERRANEEMKRLEEEEEECAKTEWERKRKENPKAWGKAKREARWEAMRVMNTIYCGNVTGIFIKKHVAQYSGRVSLQIIFGMRQEVTYEFGGNTYQDNVCICAFLWLHFNNVGRDLLSRGREWWEKLTGLKGMFPKDVEEAFEMRGLIVKPVTASYQVLSGRDGFYNSVSDVSYGEQGHPGTDGKLYREFNKERSLRRANELLKHYKVLKTKVKRSMKSAEQEYEQAIANAVARYNAVMEMSQSDYDTALKLKQEADELTAVYANADKVIETALSDDAPF
jgi:superfamily II DNA or RNA helicase